ncbi:MAG TPA: hypothetical protein VKB47_17995 [Terracidiphilus sp.]|nr:hypothetical protein [Terracidiphilus sp.]
MSKAIVGAFEIAAGVALEFIPGGQVFGSMLIAAGIATEAGAIAAALGSNSGVGVTTRQAAALRQIVRGEQRVGGTMVYCSTTGDDRSHYNMIVAFATHQIDAYTNLYLDGRQVVWYPGSSGNIACGQVATPATVTPTISGGVITGLALTAGSGGGYFAGYSSGLGASTVIPARVRIVGDGTGATATANIQSGLPINITLTNGGTGYTHATVYIDGAFLFGGTADGSTYIGPNGLHYVFGNLVQCWPYFGDQNATTGFATALNAQDSTWAANSDGTPYLGGIAYCYINIKADSGQFPQFPEIRATIRGKCDIYDPRTSTRGYTNNWALHIADAITDATWGLGDNSVNQAQLIAAANVCDEAVTCASPTIVSGSKVLFSKPESRYTLNWHYDTGTSPGDAIAQMMDAAAGRLSRIGGQWYIWPAYWQGPSFTFDENVLLEAVQWQPYRPISELCNRVVGTYIAANYPYNVAGDLYDTNGYWLGQTQNNFPYAFQPSNYPMYAADALHGYGAGVDVYLQQDGGIVLPKEVQQPCVLSIAQAQRVAKIILLRNRQQGSGKLICSLAAWQMQPMDVFQFNLAAPVNWVNKQLEVIGVTFHVSKRGNDETPSAWLELDVAETDPSVYNWTPTQEELNAYDIPVFQGQGNTFVVPVPTGLTITDDANTATIGSDGTLIPRALVQWTPPLDNGVNNGGHIELQYQFVWAAGSQPSSSPLTITVAGGLATSQWIDAGKLSGISTNCYIDNVPSTQTMNLQIRAVRADGAASAWVTASTAAHGPRPRHFSGSTGTASSSSSVTVGSSFADLSGVGGSDPGMTITCDGQPALVSILLNFAAIASGGAVTGISGFSPGATTGTAPPGITISISGDGTGASASVSWTPTGSGPIFTWTPTVHITGGSAYTTATATVTTNSNGDSGYSTGTVSYSCTLGASTTPTSGAPIFVQVLMDEGVIMGPFEITTDSTGHANLYELALVTPTPSAGSHVFEVEAMTTASVTVTSTNRSFTFVGLA